MEAEFTKLVYSILRSRSCFSLQYCRMISKHRYQLQQLTQIGTEEQNMSIENNVADPKPVAPSCENESNWTCIVCGAKNPDPLNSKNDVCCVCHAGRPDERLINEHLLNAINTIREEKLCCRYVDVDCFRNKHILSTGNIEGGIYLYISDNEASEYEVLVVKERGRHVWKKQFYSAKEAYAFFIKELRDWVAYFRPYSKESHVWFTCPKCGIHFERFGQNLSDIKFGTCPQCQYTPEESPHEKVRHNKTFKDLLKRFLDKQGAL